jgi:hypothetical protein
VHDWAEVHRLYERERLSKSQIAKRLVMSRPTVIRLPGLEGPPRYQRESPGSKLDAYKHAIAAMLDSDPEVPATVILERLRRDGYAGGITPSSRSTWPLSARVADALATERRFLRALPDPLPDDGGHARPCAWPAPSPRTPSASPVAIRLLRVARAGAAKAHAAANGALPLRSTSSSRRSSGQPSGMPSSADSLAAVPLIHPTWRTGSHQPVGSFHGHGRDGGRRRSQTPRPPQRAAWPRWQSSLPRPMRPACSGSAMASSFR